jgi:hypothetical protein
LLVHRRRGCSSAPQLRAVAEEDLHPPSEVGLRRSAGPAVAAALPGRGVLRCFESCELLSQCR